MKGLIRALIEDLAGRPERLVKWMQEAFPVFSRVCGAWWHDEILGEEIAMRTVEQALRTCRDGVQIRRERGWLSKVAVWERIRILRGDRRHDVQRTAQELEARGQVEVLRPRRQTAKSPHPDLIARGEGPLEGASREEAREKVRQAVASLPVRYRRTLTLRYLLEWTEEETRAYLEPYVGITLRGVHRILTVGRDMLAHVLRTGEDPRKTWPLRYARREPAWDCVPPPDLLVPTW